MPEIDPKIVWHYSLKIKEVKIVIGKDRWGYIRAESIGDGIEGDAIASKFNNLSLEQQKGFIPFPRDFYYDPPRESIESDVRERIEALGWFDEFELEYLLSPPNEKYVGPGTKEWEEAEEFRRENPGIHISPW